MRSRTRGLAILTSALIAAGCATSGVRPDDPAPRAEGKAIRISYVRFNQDPKTKVFQPAYYVFLGDSWREAFGSWSATRGATTKEPFRRVIRDPWLHERVPDRDMARLFDRIMDAGFDRLPERDPTGINLRRISKLHTGADPECRKGTSKTAICPHRILSIQRGSYKKTVYFGDVWDAEANVPRSRALAGAFGKVEKEIWYSRLISSCVKVATEIEPFRIPGRR
ncbi:MAG: hypothetical protein ACYTAF_05105 [Planctomycetota bacterium]